ncbi:GTP cyclohydrolase II [Streptomyces sp. B3I7]|nr:GTP cyclohydrolase II [Streptomyces sp. B3I7]
MTRIVLISGSRRLRSLNTAALATLEGILRESAEPVDTHVLVPDDLPFYDEDADAEGRAADAVEQARELVESADAVVISTPSYNGLISGLLMNTLDWLSRPWHAGALAGKPTAVLSVSTGARGGVDAQPVLRAVLERADAVLMDGPRMAIPFADALPQTGGRFTQQGVLAELTAFAHAVITHASRRPDTAGLSQEHVTVAPLPDPPVTALTTPDGPAEPAEPVEPADRAASGSTKSGHAWSVPSPARIRQSVRVPLHQGLGTVLQADLMTFTGLADVGEHLAVRLGPPAEVPLVRVHSECLTGEVFGSARCDCGPQLAEALRAIDDAGGVLLYLRQEGRGIGLYNKLDAYHLQQQGLDTYEANRALGLDDDLRDYAVAAQMLGALGHNEIDLLTNNPDKRDQLLRYGIKVRDTVSTGVFANPYNTGYLRAKVVRTSHTIQLKGSA